MGAVVHIVTAAWAAGLASAHAAAQASVLKANAAKTIQGH